MKRSWKLKLPEDRLTSIAAKLVDDHTDMLGRGFRLMASSGIWQTKRDGMTARFVYRSREAGNATTITHIIRGIRA